MPRTEEGEFELVLGNKQLLSVFFIVVILLGVFFTMGYIVGRNSAPVTASTDRGSAPVPSVGRPDTSARPSASAPAEPANQPPAAAQDSARTPATTPAQSPAPVPQTQSAAKQPEPAKAAEKPLEVAAVGSRLITPAPGQMFVQVSSMLAQAEADIMVDVLAKKGFHSVMAPGPNEGKFRVLVGPVKDAPEASKTKAELEQAGFKGAFVKKY